MSRNKEDALFSAHAILAALKSSIRVLRWGMAGLVLVYLGSGITMIQPNENGLILRLGKLLPHAYPPGLLFALPQPFDEVIPVPAKSVQERTLDTWAAIPSDSPRFRGTRDTLHPVEDPYTLTGDANIIRAKFVVRYQVADPGAYVFGAHDRDQILDALFYQSACRAIAGMPVDDALTTRRDFLGQETLRLAQAQIDLLGLGVALLAVETREIEPPRQVAEAFQDVVSAKVEAKTLVEPANSYHASAVPAAEGESYRIKTEADAYTQQLVAKAQGEASSFLALLKEYHANPQIVHARLYSEMIREVMPKVRISTVVPQNGGQMRIWLAPQVAQTIIRLEDEQDGGKGPMPLQKSPMPPPGQLNAPDEHYPLPPQEP